MSGGLDGNDKKAVHKMVRRLMKHGTWERHAQKPGRLDSITCGPVKIERWRSHNEVNVIVNGFQVCDSNFQGGLGMLAGKAKRFFYRHSEKFYHEYLAVEFAAARLAMIAAAPDALLKATDSAKGWE